MTAQGSARTRLKRALATRDPLIATAAAAEMPRVELADALSLTLIYARSGGPYDYEAAAVRWLSRLLAEQRGMTLTHVLLAAAALRAAGEAPDGYGCVALAALCEQLGRDDLLQVLDDGLDRS